MVMTSSNCEAGIMVSSDRCETDELISQLSVTHAVTYCVTRSRDSLSTILLQQRAPGIWNLAASNDLSISHQPSSSRIAFGLASSGINLQGEQVTVAGGRLSSPPVTVIGVEEILNRLLFTEDNDPHQVVLDNQGQPVLSGTP